MADKNLRFRTTNDVSNFVNNTKRADATQKKFTGGTVKSTKAQQRNTQALLQVGYGLQDLQYGFRGVFNNLQQVAALAGVGGGAFLALTALGILVQQVTENWDKFGDTAAKALAKIDQEAAKDERLSKLTLYANILKDTTSSADQLQLATERLRAAGLKENESIDEFIKLQTQKIKLRAAEEILAGRLAESTGKLVAAQEHLQELEALGPPQGGTITVGGSTVRVTQAEAEQQRADSIASARNRIASLQSDILKISQEFGVTLDKIFPEGILGAIIYGTGKGGKDFSDEFFYTAFKEYIDAGFGTLEGFKDVYERIKTQNTTLGESFEDLGGVIANGLGRSGRAIDIFVGAAIKGLTKYVAANIVANAKIVALRKAGATADAIKAATDTAATIPGIGAFLLPALIGGALAVVSGAFSGIRGGGGGSAGGGAARGYSPTGSVTPTSIQDQLASGRLVAEVSGNDLRFIIQGGNDVYTAYN